MTASAKRKKQSPPAYPQHAPDELRELYEAEKAENANHPYVTILGAMLGQDGLDNLKAMDSVWRQLKAKGMTGPEAIHWYMSYVYPSATRGPDDQQRALDNARGALEKGLREILPGSDLTDYKKLGKKHKQRLQAVASSFRLVGHPKVWAKLTQTDKKKRLKDIAEAASRLHELLENTPFNRSVYRHVDEIEAGDILEMMRRTTGLAVEQQSESNTRFLESYRSHPRMTDVLFNLRLLVLANARDMHEAIGLNMMQGMTKEVKSYRFTTPETELLDDDLVRNPNIDNADRNYFILRMAKYFKKRFHSPLYGTVTTLTNNLLGFDITKNVVTRVVRDSGI